jgi:hypothetical protein
MRGFDKGVDDRGTGLAGGAEDCNLHGDVRLRVY